jgi:hypothetical protein
MPLKRPAQVQITNSRFSVKQGNLKCMGKARNSFSVQVSQHCTGLSTGSYRTQTTNKLHAWYPGTVFSQMTCSILHLKEQLLSKKTKLK